MFFPHLREEEKRASEGKLQHLRLQYDDWTSSISCNTCLRCRHVTMKDAQMSSIELCTGEEGMSQALGMVGFNTTTLDNDLK